MNAEVSEKVSAKISKEVSARYRVKTSENLNAFARMTDCRIERGKQEVSASESVERN